MIKKKSCVLLESLLFFFSYHYSQEPSKYFCLSLKLETCLHYYVVAKANTIRYCQNISIFKHSEEIVKGNHSKHLKNQSLPLECFLRVGEKTQLYGVYN
jgi:hypothetical protein